jgi:MFS family permease
MIAVSHSSAVKNADRLLWGSFLAMIAVGMGFSARMAILGTWGAQFGFTKTELGVITGFGLTGFGMTVLLFSVLVERWGYGVMLAMTFSFHVLSGLITLTAAPVFHAFGKDAAFWCLSIGTTVFSVGNGAAEAAVNPLIAALYPTEQTHRLNMLHAGFPGGLILGALVGVVLAAARWEVILLMYLVPTVLYGVLMLGQAFPASRAKTHRIPLGSMAREFASPLFLCLLVLMAMIGFVELGTDSWISNITGNILADPKKGLYLFIWTSSLMFALRFFAGPIVDRISPLGLLFGAALFGTGGLFLLSQAGAEFNLGGAVAAAAIAASIYGIGKTFYWATMLGVTAERFPLGGALVIGAMGCVGNLSAGVLGGPTIGFLQDRFASQDLQQGSPAAYERYRADHADTLLFVFHVLGLDSSKVAVLNDDGKQLEQDLEILKKGGRKDDNIERLGAWWATARLEAVHDRQPVSEATLYGGRMALRYTAGVPAMMALGFLLLIVYFRSIGGYRQIHLKSEDAQNLAFSAGVGDDA